MDFWYITDHVSTEIYERDCRLCLNLGGGESQDDSVDGRECRRSHLIMTRFTHLIAHVPALGGGLLVLGVAVELLRRHHLVHHLLLLGGASLFRRSLQVRITLWYKIESGSVCFVNFFFFFFFFTSVIEVPS